MFREIEQKICALKQMATIHGFIIFEHVQTYIFMGRIREQWEETTFPLSKD